LDLLRLEQTMTEDLLPQNRMHLSGNLPRRVCDPNSHQTSDEIRRRYEFIVNASAEFMTLINRNYVYEAVNEAYCQAHSMPQQMILGQTVAQIWGAERFRDVIKPYLDRCFAGNQVRYQTWFEFADLDLRCMEVIYYPYYGDDQNVSHVVVITHDITEQAQAKESLRQAHEKLEARVEERTLELAAANRAQTLLSQASMGLVELSPDQDLYRFIGEQLHHLSDNAIVLVNSFDADTQTLYVRSIVGLDKQSRHLIRLLGREATGMTLPLQDESRRRYLTAGRLQHVPSGLHEICLGLLPERICRAIEKALHVGGVFTSGFIRGDRLLGSTILLAPEPGGLRNRDLVETFINLASVALQRKQSEDALRLSEEKYRDLFEQSRDAIYVTSEDGAFLDLNQAALDLFGCTWNTIRSLKAQDFYIDPAERNKFQRTITRQRFVKDYPVRLRKPDGTAMECLITASARHTDDGRIVGYQGIIRDLTQQKRLEERLRQQDRMAALGQLAGGIAHDFNNVLMSIILYTETLLDEPALPTELAQDMQSILDDAQDASKIVQQILDFSRRAPLETRSVDLAELVQKFVQMIRRILPSSIDVSCLIQDGPHVVNADASRLQQALMNLTVNARDAMPDGGKLRIGLSRLTLAPGQTSPATEMPPGEWICLTVTDTGIGIAPDIRDHIFEPFFTTKFKGEGTGLGLAQVYGIIAQHGGYIGLETEAGSGATFYLYLPPYQTQDDPAQARPTRTKGAAVTGAGETILVVEDEANVRQSTQKTLESLGYRVLTAANGQQALQVYRSTPGINLVLTDMMMPEMNGQQLVEELSRIAPNCRIVVMTGYVLSDDLQRLNHEAKWRIVPKPLDTNALSQAIRQTLDGQRPQKKGG